MGELGDKFSEERGGFSIGELVGILMEGGLLAMEIGLVHPIAFSTYWMSYINGSVLI